MKSIKLILLFCAGIVSAQETLQLSEGESSPKANLEDVSWIEGHWTGEAFGGIAEEIWSAPLGNSMMFVFRLVNDDKVSFYESGHIQQLDDSIILQLKHFDGNMRGWEEKDQTIDFKLVKLEPNKVYFEGLTMEKISEDQINVWVLIEENGNTGEVLFAYNRMK
ncbi:MAG TPA: hypothetical protein DEF18_04240 [Muricauda sp.]|uniref:DUF6265 domain-containing protein n=1 Tax=Flagellimonas aurea TaxID=2915619 RepID=A0ABS3G7X2_9FLAO|nr:DUF6265 family protein [Allomuricauda aurea]MAO16222.1 hypothetical protein [Allomuricauda sp.]MBC70795.1 hypothetical protein [Allomuricauda sp.]MBO0355515.1 hypothetical protein [Allomuricauda aurea]HBU77289.1 hypothetical protein [Allomuricauda sp.]|tara:strand:+ start:896 stop:1387 length:492 start_codon:yes stop_codon:yes gene_type:complete